MQALLSKLLQARRWSTSQVFMRLWHIAVCFYFLTLSLQCQTPEEPQTLPDHMNLKADSLSELNRLDGPSQKSTDSLQGGTPPFILEGSQVAPERHAAELSNARLDAGSGLNQTKRMPGSQATDSIWENPDWNKPPKQKPAPHSVPQNGDRTTNASSQSIPEDGSLKYERQTSDLKVMQQVPRGIPVLCYHHNFRGNQAFGGYNITPDQLEAQLRLLQNEGYRTISMHQLQLFIQGRTASLPARPVVLTFDDGLRSNYTTVLPLLKKYGMQATLFIYPGIIGKGKKNHLNWEELRRLVQSGHIEIGSHTINHPRLPEHSRKEIRRQLVQSKSILERKLGVRVETIAYPFGVYDRRVLEEVRAAGYKLGFSIHGGSNQRGMDGRLLNRFMVTGAHNLKRFKANLELRSPARIALEPGSGSTVRSGQHLVLNMQGLQPLSIKVSGRKLNWNASGSQIITRMPSIQSKLGYMTLSVHARAANGQAVYREYLLLDQNRFKMR